MPDFSPSRLKAIKYRKGRQGSFEVLIYPPTQLPPLVHYLHPPLPKGKQWLLLFFRINQFPALG